MLSLPTLSFPRSESVRSGEPRGFTLIELLVAAVVLVMLVLLVAQMVQSGNLIISGSRKHLSADSQAREVFSHFASDLNRMPNRADLDAILSSSNNAIFFYSEAPGYAASTNATERNTLALVGYRVNTNAQLERLGKGLSWTNAPFLTYSVSTPTNSSVPLTASTMDGTWGAVLGSAPAYNNGVDADYHLLADSVFRMFYCFQRKDGSYSLSAGTNSTLGKFQDTAAVVLTLAILDGESRKIIADATKLADALPDPTAANLSSGVLPAQLWQTAVNNPAQFATAAGIPPSAASRVRIYQRSFPVSTR